MITKNYPSALFLSISTEIYVCVTQLNQDKPFMEKKNDKPRFLQLNPKEFLAIEKNFSILYQFPSFSTNSSAPHNSASKHQPTPWMDGQRYVNHPNRSNELQNGTRTYFNLPLNPFEKEILKSQSHISMVNVPPACSTYPSQY